METKLKPYPEYRETDLPWAGRLPAHWDTERAKWLFTKMERPVRPEDETITCFRDGVVTLRKNRRTTGFTESLKEIGYQGIRKGDLVIHAMDAFAGAVGVSDSDGKGTPVYAVCRPREGVDAEYYARVVREMARTQYIAALAKGIRQRSTDFRYATFAGEAVPVPPPDEQRAISRFLIGYDRRVNRLIRTKQRLIALLNEQKQAIIQRAVTRGLDPDVPLKSSGVDWLGDVPAHWGVMPIKYLCNRIQNGATPPTSDQSYYRNGILPWFGPSSLGSGVEVGEPVRYVNSNAFGEGVARKLHAPALLVIVIGATAGRASLLREDGATNQQITAFELNTRKVDPEYVVQQVKLAETWLRSSASTATIPIIDSGTVARLPIVVPPREEQEVLRRRLNIELAVPNKAITRAEQEIDLIREYRTRLIADVVTGKLDVRGVAVPEVEGDGINADLKVSGDDDADLMDEVALTTE